LSIDSNGKLVYTPAANFVGNDTITYQVCDNGTPSLCVSGKVVITVTGVAPLNHAPVLSDITKTSVQDQNVTFTRTDFTSKFTDADNDTLVKIRFVALPSHGVLQINGVPVTVNQEIAWTDLNKLVFVPDKDYYGETTFGWEATDGKDYSATSAGITITIAQAEVFIPEGFSPNGDGVNDYFYIKGADKYIVTLKIYNRWGNLVYESKHYQNDWDGISNTGLLLSTKLPDGTYFYSIDFNNGEKKKVGYITINR
jgi:gliding motility-associated-like protein